MLLSDRTLHAHITRARGRLGERKREREIKGDFVTSREREGDWEREKEIEREKRETQR